MLQRKRLPIVTWSDCLKSFLPSSVPNLQFDFLSLHFDCFDFKINTYCWNKCCIDCVVYKPKEFIFLVSFVENILPEEQTSFSNSWIANEQKFEKKILLVITIIPNPDLTKIVPFTDITFHNSFCSYLVYISDI